jgi:hypothetical protein
MVFRESAANQAEGIFLKLGLQPWHGGLTRGGRLERERAIRINL